MTSARRLHPAWVVLAALTFCMLASTGVRSVFGVYIKPMEVEMHWSRGALSTAAAVGLLLLGAAGPPPPPVAAPPSPPPLLHPPRLLACAARPRRAHRPSSHPFSLTYFL